MSQPEQPPKFFLDRSLGRKAVPEALRADDWDVITLAEHYGMPADEPRSPPWPSTKLAASYHQR